MTVVLRPSELARYADCAGAWAANSAFAAELDSAGFVLPAPLAHVAAAIGTAVHAGIERALRGRSINSPGGLESCLEAADEVWRSEVRAAGGPGQMVWDSSSRPSDARGQIERMIRAWIAYRLDHVEPASIEARHEMEVAPGVILSGQLDHALQFPHEVRDIKTSGWLPSPQIQLGCYVILREHATDELVGTASMDLIPRLPLSRRQKPPVLHEYDAQACKAAAWTVIRRAIQSAIAWNIGGKERADAFARNPASALCSARWCRAHGTEFCPITVVSRRTES